MGGRPDRPWKPLTPWTIQTSKSRKPLQGLERLIRYEANSYRATIYGAPTGGGWDIDQHHSGYYTPARYAHGKAMMVKVGRTKLFFRTAKEFVVEARPFWPTDGQVKEIATDAVADWVAQGARRIWR